MMAPSGTKTGPRIAARVHMTRTPISGLRLQMRTGWTLTATAAESSELGVLLWARRLTVSRRSDIGLHFLRKSGCNSRQSTSPRAAACETGRCAQPRYMGRSKRAMTQRERALTERLARTR